MVMRTAFLSASALIAMAFWGMSVYVDGAHADFVPQDGYGISALDDTKLR